MLKTYTQFMRLVNRHIEDAEWWETQAEKYCKYDPARYSKNVAYGREHRIAVLELCEKYPIFASLYKLNKNRKAS